MTMTDTSTETDARPILERARSAMSGLTTVEAAITEVAEQLRQARATVRPEEDVAELALSAVLAGDPVPDDLADRVLAIRRSNESAFAEASVLGPLEHRLREQLLAVHRDRVDDALAVLRAELDTVISQAGPVLAELGAVPGERATLLQFSSAFCAPCRATRRVLGEVVAMVEGVSHVEVDAEQHLDVVRELGIAKTPTTLVLDAHGRETLRASGQPRKADVLAALGKALP